MSLLLKNMLSFSVSAFTPQLNASERFFITCFVKNYYESSIRECQAGSIEFFCMQGKQGEKSKGGTVDNSSDSHTWKYMLAAGKSQEKILDKIAL